MPSAGLHSPLPQAPSLPSGCCMMIFRTSSTPPKWRIPGWTSWTRGRRVLQGAWCGRPLSRSKGPTANRAWLDYSSGLFVPPCPAPSGRKIHLKFSGWAGPAPAAGHESLHNCKGLQNRLPTQDPPSNCQFLPARKGANLQCISGFSLPERRPKAPSLPPTARCSQVEETPDVSEPTAQLDSQVSGDTKLAESQATEPIKRRQLQLGRAPVWEGAGYTNTCASLKS